MNVSMIDLLPDDVVHPERLDPDERLFRHEKRPDWGVGLWVREERTRRRLRFEDGELRIFKKGFYHLLVPIDPARVDVETLFEEIASDHEVARRELAEQRGKAKKPPVMTFAEQLMVFEHIFPEGFHGEGFRNAYRENIKGNRRKSHLGLSSKEAQELLRPGHVKYEDAMSILQGTRLVSPTKLGPLKGISEEDQRAFEEALEDLLFGEDRYRDRFGRWMVALRRIHGEGLRWPLATALPALVKPERHIRVKRRVFNVQAREVKPGTSVAKNPGRRGYRNARRIAAATRKQLIEAGHEPRDMLDVGAFIWESLRPKGRKTLDQLKGR